MTKLRFFRHRYIKAVEVWQFLSWNFSVLLARSLTKKISVAQFCCNVALIRQTNPEIKVSSCSSMTTLSFHVETI